MTNQRTDHAPLAARLKAARELSGLPAAALSQRVPLFEEDIKRIESGHRNPSPTELREMCDVLGLSFEELVADLPPEMFYDGPLIWITADGHECKTYDIYGYASPWDPAVPADEHLLVAAIMDDDERAPGSERGFVPRGSMPDALDIDRQRQHSRRGVPPPATECLPLPFDTHIAAHLVERHMRDEQSK